MAKKRVLTGVKPTHYPHFGNYLGAIRPALQLANGADTEAALFIADYHALTSVHKATEMTEYSYGVAATWIACGLDPEQSLIYRQSDVPEIFELNWILACFAPKGLLNRAHAYKAIVQANEEAGKKDLDAGVSMGLFTYPILMSADILMFSADEVPVGEDQIQHVEIARDIAQKFNHTYKKEVLKLPKFVAQKDKTILGLDGRKMSKSYNNHIPLFCEEKKLRKLVMKIKTDSSPPEAPKDPNNSLIFELYKEFANESQISELKSRYEQGIAWGDAKQALFELVNDYITPARDKFNELMNNKDQLDNYLAEGCDRARSEASTLLTELRKTTGIRHG